MSKKILISGANGFIGKHLCSYFIRNNYTVYGLVRQLPAEKIEGVHYQKFDLEEIDEKVIKAEYQCFIHAAYILDNQQSSSDSINIQASQKLYHLCRDRGVHYIFLSSLSALPDALSKYGQSKYRIEQMLNTEDCTIVRPGLVIGDGGLYKSMQDFIRKSKLVPLFGGGRQIIQQIQVEELCKLLYNIADRSIKGSYSFAEEESVSMKDWYKSIAASLGASVRFVSIPYFFADIMFYILDMLPLDLGVGRENYLGLKQMKFRELSDPKPFQ